MTVLDLLTQEFALPEGDEGAQSLEDARTVLQPFVRRALRIVADGLEGPNREDMARWVLGRYLAAANAATPTSAPEAPPAQVVVSDDDHLRYEREHAEAFAEETLRRRLGLPASDHEVGSTWRDWG
jgi:hypothetical protein